MIFRGRSSSASVFQASLLRAIDGVMPLALCPQVVSQAPQYFRSSETEAFWGFFSSFSSANLLVRCFALRMTVTVFTKENYGSTCQRQSSLTKEVEVVKHSTLRWIPSRSDSQTTHTPSSSQSQRMQMSSIVVLCLSCFLTHFPPFL